MNRDSFQKSTRVGLHLVCAALVGGLSACESTSLEFPSGFVQARQLAFDARWMGYGVHGANYVEAAKKMEQAIDVLTDGGKLANGRQSYYVDAAKFHSDAATFYLSVGDISKATNSWRKSFNESIQGEINAAAKFNEAERANATMGMVVTGLLGAYAVSRAPDSSTAQQALNLTSQTIKTLGESLSTTGRVLPELTRPVDGVYRVPATVHAEPFNRIYRLRTSNSYCTAFAVSLSVFLTNAHCVTSNKGRTVRSPSELTLISEQFLPGTALATGNKANGSKDVPENIQRSVRYFVTHAGTNGGYDGQFENDWAILVINKDPGKGFPNPYPIFYGGFADDAFTTVTVNSTELMLGGYSADLVKGQYMTLHWGCKATRIEAEIHSNCESTGGSSGSPVMLAKPPFTLVGINAGDRTYRNQTTGEVKRTDVHVNIRQFVRPLKEVLEREK